MFIFVKRWLLAVVAMLALGQAAAILPSMRAETAGDQHFETLAASWDEGVPLGNATLGALIWQRNGRLRFSLDRTDLWDLRKNSVQKNLKGGFDFVKAQLDAGTYNAAQARFDAPYDTEPMPCKIPGAAIEFPIQSLGPTENVSLYLREAICEIRWKNGTLMRSFVSAVQPVGWFEIVHAPKDLVPDIDAPQFRADGAAKDGIVGSLSLARLGYDQGTLTRDTNALFFRQPGEPGFFYEAAVRWQRRGDTLIGVWSLSTSRSGKRAADLTAEAMKRGIAHDFQDHIIWWRRFGRQSSVLLPDPVLQKQYENEMYKFGSAARNDSYPISLQAVWTADNGQLPPWKGDYHHDLNTQLSYWPAYIGNHLSEGLGYLNTLWNQRDTFKRYTQDYFGKPGMAIPGVATLTGEPLGGWCQYAMSPTAGAWLAHHFWQHWKFSNDSHFLKNRGYPFLHDTCVFLEAFSQKDENGVRTLPLSSSPEYNDNSAKAWFRTMTNYDLALCKKVFAEAAEMARALGKKNDAERWARVGKEFPDFDLDANGALTIAKGAPYNHSHRHFSHALSIYPLGLLDITQGETQQRIIENTLQTLEKHGPSMWTGYSYSWLGCLWARARNGEKAASYLKIFANHFCLRNTFHANGDQTKSGKSSFTYRPFTLEGNFAFAAGIQEMLLQSHTKAIRIFPAVPKDWKNVSFRQLRAIGAYLVSAEMFDGKVRLIEIAPQRGGICTVELPPSMAPDKITVTGQAGPIFTRGNTLTIPTKPYNTVTIRQ